MPSTQWRRHCGAIHFSRPWRPGELMVSSISSAQVSSCLHGIGTRQGMPATWIWAIPPDRRGLWFRVQGLGYGAVVLGWIWAAPEPPCTQHLALLQRAWATQGARLHARLHSCQLPGWSLDSPCHSSPITPCSHASRAASGGLDQGRSPGASLLAGRHIGPTRHVWTAQLRACVPADGPIKLV